VSHAVLSASGSHKWLNCTPSARLEAQFKNETSVYAQEGTAAHELSEHKLREYLGIETKRPESEFDSEELEYYTDAYVTYAVEQIKYAKQRCKDPIVLIEQRLDYSHYVPGGFGTGDLVIVADGTLDVVDLKYGKGVAVSAVDNPQMKLYALGALALFDNLYDIKTVRMVIVQPRLESISEYEVSVDELISWAETELREKAELADLGEGDFCSGEHCRFCRARHTCRARAEEHLSLAKYEFKLPSLLTDEEVAQILTVADRLSQWANDVYSYATDLAINEGKEWDGFKIVEGRSNRKFTNEDSVANICIENGFDEVYKKTLKGITDLEKYLTKKRFNELLGGLVVKPKGKPTLVPIGDKREKIIVNNTATADFKEEI